ncbi:MAG: Ig-like domain-containing protein [Planctomycetota bacterium]
MHTTRALVFLVLVTLLVAAGCNRKGGGGGGGATTNSAPTVAASIAIETDEDTNLSVDLKAFVSDPDGDTISIGSIVTPPMNGALSAVTATGEVTFSPAANFTGADSFRFRASDGRGGEVEGLVGLTVRPVNDPPEVLPGSLAFVTPEDTPITLDLGSLVIDVDADPVQISAIVTPPVQGTLGALSGGSVTYTPAPDQSGTDTFRFRASDGQGGDVEADVSLTIQPVNDAPVAQSGVALSTPEDTALTIDLGSLVTDVDGDPVQIDAIVQLPSLGTVGAIVGTSVEYTPAANQSGADSFRYRAIDGQGGSVEGEVAITIDPVNDDPVAVDDIADTLEGVAVVVAVLANDSDAELDPLTILSVTAPGLGTAVIAPSGTEIEYTPPSTGCVTDSFTYTIGDGNGGTATGTVDVTVICAELELSGSPIQETYDVTMPSPVVTTTISLREPPTSTGFPSDVTGWVVVIEHDPNLLSFVAATPSAILAALNGGAGPDVFDATSPTPGVVNVTVTLGASVLVPGSGADLFTVEYQPVSSAATGNLVGITTFLTWGQSTIALGLGSVQPTTTEVSVELTPEALPSADFFFITPGARVVYDSLLGTASHTQAVLVQEGPGDPSFPRAIDGFSLGLAEDPNLLTPISVALGSDAQALNGGAGPDFFVANVLPGGGIVVAAVVSIQFLEALPAAQAREVLRVEYEANPTALAGNATGTSTSLAFVSTLGPPVVPAVSTLVVVGPVGFTPVGVTGTFELFPSP